MRTIRIYVNAPLNPGTLVLSDNHYQHLITVLRLKKGATIEVFNHDQTVFEGTLSQIDKKTCTVLLETPKTPLPVSPLHIHLGLSMMKGDRMDFSIQKSVELGVREITPLTTQFTEVGLFGERAQKKQAHWEKVMIHACEQCGRTDIPRLHPLRSWNTWINQPYHGLQYILHTQPSNTSVHLAQSLEKTQQLRVAVGPEGGFHSDEILQALTYGFESIQLGPRILRGETAPLAFLSILQWLKGDLQ